jgi:TolB-like protein/tRNA A-37 threonylcarbamoyl transferase component Bud32
MDMVGQTVSHYRVLGKLGGGGMGVVYEAEDTRLGRRVALKFIPDHLVKDQRSLERFTREARAASQLNHLNICTIHDIEDNDGHPFIVMEKLEGESLKQRIREQEGPSHAIPTDEVIEIAMQVADALAASHAKGIVHRDIKPANIFLTPGGQVKILDFGLAKLTKDGKVGTSTDSSLEESLTQVGVIPGTAVYMSPEQARSEDLDVRTDIFSFGVVLYEMATGKKPFTGTNVVTTLHAVINSKPAPPRSVNPAVPKELEAIIGKAMEKDRDQRYKNAAEMKTDLARLQQDRLKEARAESDSSLQSGLRSGLREGMRKVGRAAVPRISTRAFENSRGKRTWLIAGMAALAVLVIAMAGGMWWMRHRSATPAVAGRRTIAVLPLQNMGNNPENEFLRIALADEISNALMHSPALEIRPSPAVQKDESGAADAAKIGRDLGVATVVAGSFLRQKQTVILTLQAVDVKDNRLVWTGTLQAPTEDLIELRKQMEKKVKQELLPALGVANWGMEESSVPVNPEAYHLYMQSAAIPRDVGPNKDAITMLEKAVKLDPNYAPAWEALGHRYYYDAVYSGGGPEGYERSNGAYRKALALEPGRTDAAGSLAINLADTGNLEKALEDARALVKRRPDVAFAHFSLAYVLRYAGLLDRSQSECDRALGIEPKNYAWRSCAFAFFEAGKEARALEYLKLDEGSEYANAVKVTVLMREGKMTEAQRAVQPMTENPLWMRAVLQACLNKAPAAEMHHAAETAEKELMAVHNSALKYYEGAVLANCGEKQIAYEFLRKAVEGRYCAHEALLEDPLLAGERGDAEFQEIVRAAAACEEKVASAAK